MYARLLPLLLLALPLALAARKNRGQQTAPPPVADPSPDETPAEAEPKAAKAPKLFPEGLPVAHQALPGGVASLSAQSCNGCHYEIHDSWADSAHADALGNEAFQAAMAATGNSPLCTSCHTPLVNQQPALVREYSGGPLGSALVEPNESWDASLSAEGVTCAACHVRGETVVGSRPASGAPHPVAVSEELGSSEFCASCHQLDWEGAEAPLYDTYGEWSRSPYPAAGVQCQDCHMPPRSGLITAGDFAAHRDHGVTADPARAVTMLADIPPGGLTRGETLTGTLTLMNTGAGHSFPTGSPFTLVVVQVVAVDAEGQDTGEPFELRLERPIAAEPPFAPTGPDTRLKAGETRAVEFSLSPEQKAEGGQGALEIRLLEEGPQGDRTLLHTQRIPLAMH